MPHFLLFIASAVLVHLISAQCPAVRDCLKGDICPFLPVPSSSLRPSIPEDDGFLLTELRPGVFSFFDGVYGSLILHKARRLAVIDPAESSVLDGKHLLATAAIRALQGQMPTRLDIVYSHRHVDHNGGTGMFLADIKLRFPRIQVFVWGTPETKRHIADIKSTTIPQVTVLVRKNRTVNVADDLNMELTVLRGHTQQDLSCLVKRNSDGPGVLHFVDFVTPGLAPFLRFAVAEDIMAYIRSQEKVLSLDWEILSAGHGRLGRKKDLQLNIQYTKDTLKFNREAAAEVTTEQLIAAGIGRISDPSAVEFGNEGLAFIIAANTQGKICARKLIRKYGCILGSVAVFALSHCDVAFVYEAAEV